MGGFPLRDRALAKIDDTMFETIGREMATAWSKDAGGEKVERVVSEFEAGLPRLLDLRERVRAAVSAAIQE